MKLTYGVELEWPDVDPTTELFDGWAWSKTDYTIVNSDGTANDPSRGPKRLPRLGGELNSPVCDSAEELAALAEIMWRLLKPGYNYRSNLHIHIGANWTLPDVKQLAEFTRDWLPPLLPLIDPLNMLLDGHTFGTPDFIDATKRLQHSEKSRHYLTTPERHQRRMAASTLEEALAAECPRSAGGAVQWHLASREAVNLRSLRKHGTVEFRLFAAPRNSGELMAAAWLAGGWVEHALLGADPRPLVAQLAPYLPRQAPFDPTLERGWQMTNLHTNKRADQR